MLNKLIMLKNEHNLATLTVKKFPDCVVNLAYFTLSYTGKCAEFSAQSGNYAER